MSPRIKILRKVLNPPVIKGFKPYGFEPGQKHDELINLFIEEYEALRLSDYDNCNHHQSSVLMGVSRPTFTRIYASALQKIAKAFVEGKQISIEGGKIYFDSDWYQCFACQCYFNNPEKDKKIENCPLCGSNKIMPYENFITDDEIMSYDNTCVCPNCGYQQQYRHGKPCNLHLCPQCNSLMRRKGSPHCRNTKSQTI
jgi:predicted DNA-binding protein (UPF0251 family)